MISLKASIDNTKIQSPSNEEAEDIIDETQNDSKPKKLPKVTINTSNTRGEFKLIQYLIEKNKKYGWGTAINFDGDLMWAGLEIPWDDKIIAPEMHLNRIPGVADIASKKVTGYYLNKFREYYPEEYDFFPRTFLIPEESDALEDFMKKNPSKYLIAKPSEGSQGDGIVLMKKFQDLPKSQFGSAYNDVVVQEYIDNPLLVDGKKFDLRLYVLISNVKPMIAFLNDEGLARFSTENYEKPTKENFRKIFMHLTNYSLNKNSPDFIYTEECFEINQGTKRTFSSFWKSIEKAGYDKETIIENIRRLLKNLLISIQPYIEYTYSVAFSKSNGKCFHVLGIDILIDENLKPWLLEINSNPSMNIDHELEEGKKPIINPVDRYVKAMVMEDAILISRKKHQKQAEIERYGSFELLFKSEEANEMGMALFKDMVKIYSKLSGAKFKSSLTSSRFAKLGTLSGMTTTGFNKVDYDILFKKLLKESDEKTMNFTTLIKALEFLAKRLLGTSDKGNMESIVNTILSQL